MFSFNECVVRVAYGVKVYDFERSIFVAWAGHHILYVFFHAAFEAL